MGREERRDDGHGECEDPARTYRDARGGEGTGVSLVQAAQGGQADCRGPSQQRHRSCSGVTRERRKETRQVGHIESEREIENTEDETGRASSEQPEVSNSLGKWLGKSLVLAHGYVGSR